MYIHNKFSIICSYGLRSLELWFTNNMQSHLSSSRINRIAKGHKYLDATFVRWMQRRHTKRRVCVICAHPWFSFLSVVYVTRMTKPPLFSFQPRVLIPGIPPLSRRQSQERKSCVARYTLLITVLSTLLSPSCVDMCTDKNY